MRRIVFLCKLMVVCVLLVSCVGKTKYSETTALAYSVYQLYADREDVTVSLVGDYKVDTNSYTLLLFRTQDSISWIALLNEFGIQPETDLDIFTLKTPREDKNAVSALLDFAYEREYEDSIVLEANKDIRNSFLPEGYRGYMAFNFYETLSLWMFFFRNREEMESIVDVMPNAKSMAIFTM